MSKPQSKSELIEAATVNYHLLMDFIASMTEKELNTPFDFSKTTKKEAHWKRDKNLRDVLVHLYEWHKLLLEWLENNRKGVRKPFLMEGYNWKSYGDMNMVFWRNCQNLSLEDAMERFKASYQDVMKELDAMTNEELFSRNVYDWVGGSTIGSYFISNTSSHYDWAMKKLKAHRKMLLK